MPTNPTSPARETPPDGVMRLELLTPAPDPQGRSAFTLTWRGYRPDLNTEGLRAQYFHGNLAQHLRDLTARGWRIQPEGRHQQAAAGLIEQVRRERHAAAQSTIARRAA